MARLLDALDSGRVLLMDGAMGSELYQSGLDPAECGELWNLSRPEKVLAIHRGYVAAGSRCLLTNSFQANPINLGRHGLEEEMERICLESVRLARRASGRDGYVLADIGPILISETDREFSDWHDLVRVVESFVDGRLEVDGLLLETCSTPRSLSAVEMLRKRVLDSDDLPILLSITYRGESNGTLRSQSGHGPETFARHAERHGVTALGVNCGRDIGMEETIALVRRYREATDLPLFARPNAGTPSSIDGLWVYPRTPEMLAERLWELLECGVALVGGCCGTTPAHIAAFRPIVEEWNAREEE